LLGQLHAHLLELGDLLPREHVRSAIGAVFAHNFKRDFRDHVNCQRTYVLNDEAGLLLCTWPRSERPRLPFVYSDEVWTGVEYQVAAHLITLGEVEAGLEIVRAVRKRHDGLRRNPWNEVECGHHYARSMSSWALLLALSGFRCDVAQGALAFAPAYARNDFRCFFSTGTAWGCFAQQIRPYDLRAELVVEQGQLALQRLRLASTARAAAATAELNGQRLAARLDQGEGQALILFDPPVELSTGERLSISLVPT
jgi:hypothetical protein